MQEIDAEACVVVEVNVTDEGLGAVHVRLEGLRSEMETVPVNP